MGNVEYEGDDNWGDYFYIICDKDELSSNILPIVKHSQYIGEIDIDEIDIMYIFKITTEQKLTIVNPFLRGEYSKIDSSYFYSHFKKIIGNTKSVNWMIYHKDSTLRRSIENRLGTTLPDNAELCSKPLKRNEIYAYDSLLNTD